MVAEVCLGKVGAVAAREVSRFARNSRDWQQLVEMWEKQSVFATQSAKVVEAQRAGRLSFDPAELASLLRTYGQGVMPPVWDQLPGLAMPALCLAGALDKKYVAAGERMASLLPNGGFRSIARAGHAPQLEDPDAVAVELRAFLHERL